MTVSASLDPQWLAVPDVAETLGLELRTVRNLLREGEALAVPVEGLVGPRVPSAFLARTGRDLFIDGLRGSITQLRDKGFEDDEIVTWLLSPNEELGETPAAALAGGHKHAVRRAAVGLA